MYKYHKKTINIRIGYTLDSNFCLVYTPLAAVKKSFAKIKQYPTKLKARSLLKINMNKNGHCLLSIIKMKTRMHSSSMRTARLLFIVRVSLTERPPWTETPWTETLPPNREPPPRGQNDRHE